ncbi:MAG TPA: N-formylglutamate deformylase [Rhodobacteraceae bacterium]|nr:N-formylglutamate deformylase [Paracoccaceae bacterium]
MKPVEVIEGAGPVVLAMPHGGGHIPAAIEARLNETGRARADTDWHIDRLYDGLLPGATIVRALFHRYVIDANRAPDDADLYPGQNGTGLCPLTDFDGRPIYGPGPTPDRRETDERRRDWHDPYHRALARQLERLRRRYGAVVLYDCHSIRSTLPYLFDGRLPDFNIGTDDGRSCAAPLQAAAAKICARATGYTLAVNGRFRGGWTTRHYGRPEAGVHAIQMELAQAAYMDERPPWRFDEARAAALRVYLADILTTIEHMALSGALQGQEAEP